MKYKVEYLDKRFCDIDPNDTGTATLRWYIMDRAKDYSDPVVIAEKLKTITDDELTELIEFYDYLNEK